MEAVRAVAEKISFALLMPQYHALNTTNSETTIRHVIVREEAKPRARRVTQTTIDFSTMDASSASTTSTESSALITPWTTVRVASVVVRIEFYGAKLRIKQNLANEYSAAGYTHAALFPPYGRPDETHLVHIDGQCAAGEMPGCVVGVDYARERCIAGILFGTQYEIRIEDEDSATREITSEMLVHLVEQLRPVSDLQVPYAHALYFGRYPRAIHKYRGPMSLFAYQWTFGVTNSEAAWRSAHSEAPRLEGERALGIDLPQSLTLKAPRGSTPPLIFTLDSIGTVSRMQQRQRGTEPNRRRGRQGAIKVREMLALYWSPHRHAFIWVRFLRARSQQPMKGRLPLDHRYPVTEQMSIVVGNKRMTRDVHLACVTEENGAWEAVSQALLTPSTSTTSTRTSDYIILIQMSPCAASSKIAFTSMVRTVLRQVVATLPAASGEDGSSS